MRDELNLGITIKITLISLRQDYTTVQFFDWIVWSRYFL